MGSHVALHTDYLCRGIRDNGALIHENIHGSEMLFNTFLPEKLGVFTRIMNADMQVGELRQKKWERAWGKYIIYAMRCDEYGVRVCIAKWNWKES